MKKRFVRAFLAVNILMLATQHTTKAQVSLTTIGTAYTQDFNSFAGSAASLPPGWTAGGTFVYRGTGNGSSNSGGSWGYGTGESSLGYLGSGTSTPITYSVSFVNNTGSTVNSIDISYNFENWRNAGGNTIGFTAGGFGALAGSSGAISAGLSQTSCSCGTTGVPTTVAKTVTLTGLSIPNGGTFGLTFSSSDGSGNDNGKSIDDFSLTPRTNMPNLSINNITLNEGNAGTTNFNFVVSLSSPAGAGGVSFNIATADQTATAASGDYTNTSLTAQTIPAGATSYTFTVPVNGDVVVEPNETFFVNVTSVTGATVLDGQGLGTITNEDFNPPIVTLDPISGTYCNGASVSLSSLANGTPAPTVQWQVSTNGGTTWANIPLATLTTHTFVITSADSANMYHAVFTNLGGTDTSLAATLLVNPTYQANQSFTLCSGSSFTFPDGTTQNNITAPVTHNSNLLSINSCDSIIITTVNVNPVYNFTESVSICSGSNYTYPDGTVENNITTTTTHVSSFQTVNACDSNIVTTINVNPVYNIFDTVFVCSGNNYTYPDGTIDNNITVATTHISALQSVSFCDSIIFTTVNVNPVFNLNDTVYVCNGGSYTYPDGMVENNITATATHTSALQTINACDSIIVTTVFVNPVYNTTDGVFVCSGNNFTYPDGTVESNVTATATHTSNLLSISGCDSIVTTTILVNPVYNTTDTVFVCSGNNFTYPDGTVESNVTATATHISNLLSISGCDSIVITTILVNPTYMSNESFTICSGSSYTFPDSSSQTNITATVLHVSTLQTINGCDSIISTTINVNPVYTISESVFVCNGSNYTYPDGTVQSNIMVDTVHTSNLQTVNGCDSTIVTTVNVNQNDTNTVVQSICAGDSVNFYGSNLNASGSYYHTLTNVSGCDSIIMLDLTVNLLPTVTFDYMGGAVNSICAEVEDTLYFNGGMPAGGFYTSPFAAGDTLFPQYLVDNFGAGTYGFEYVYTDVLTGCSNSATDSLAIAYCIGLKEQNQAGISVSVYPNPAHDKVFVALGSIIEKGKITVFNTLGQVVMLKELEAGARLIELNLSEVAKGVYYLSVENRYESNVKKIVVE